MLKLRMSRGLRAGLAVAAAALVVSGAAPLAHAAPPRASVTLSLVAYSTPREAYAALIAAFQKTPAGQGVAFQTSFGASGDQSRAVDAGLPADIVAFSLEPDITRLVKDNLVAPTWNKTPTHGMVTDSVVVFAVRPGNPKHIHSWQDLIKPGVQVITPNPFTSGGARWNIMAAYGALLESHYTPRTAIDYLRTLFAHVVVQDKSAREELQTFAGGKGDVMLAYENEAITAQRKGVKLQYVVPAQTILIENPIAVTSNSGHAAQAQAFVDFVLSSAGQRIWGQQGYRPVLSAVARPFGFPRPQGLFTINDLGLGGWTKVAKTFFDPQSGIVAGIERSLGVSVAAR
jgi:sulfate transport system substrate-binding protein